MLTSIGKNGKTIVQLQYNKHNLLGSNIQYVIKLLHFNLINFKVDKMKNHKLSNNQWHYELYKLTHA